MKTVKINGIADTTGNILMPPHALHKLGIKAGTIVSLIFRADQNEDASEDIMVSREAAGKTVSPEIQLTLTPEMFCAANIPFGCEFEIICEDGAIILAEAEDEDDDDDDDDDIPPEVYELCDKFGIGREEVRDIINEYIQNQE